MESDPGFQAALAQARKGASEGGVPIGAVLVAADGTTILGRGHNQRIQKGSATLHVGFGTFAREGSNATYAALRTITVENLGCAEIDALENAGRLPASSYRGATMYTTLSPCDMCTGACVMFKVSRVVIGENKNFVGGEDYLRQKGIEVVVLDNEELKGMMAKFIEEKPEEWYEDIGEDPK